MRKKLCNFGHQKIGLLQASHMRNLHYFGNEKHQNNNPSHVTSWETLCRESQLDMAVNTPLCKDLFQIPPHCVYLPLMNACMKRKDLAHARKIHTYLALHHPLELTSSLGEHLVLTLARCGGLEDACDVFHKLSHRTVLSWTAIISGYTERFRGTDALRLYQSMQEDGVQPNQYTYVSLLKACASIRDLVQGTRLHDDLHARSLSSNIFIRSSLVSMYGKCGSIVDAENVFTDSFQNSSVLWNAMLATYAEQGQGERALQLYRQMRHESVCEDDRTFAIVLQACGSLGDDLGACGIEGHLEDGMLLEIGQALHSEARRKGFASILFVTNTLVNMYGKLGRIVEAESVFQGLSQRNVVSWSLMISALAEQGQGGRALLFYKQMQGEGVKPDERMYVISLQACECFLEEGESSEGGKRSSIALEICRGLHADTVKVDSSLHNFVANTLVSVYGKCGSIAEAESVFECSRDRNVVSWNAMISSYLDQGQAEKCLQLYRQMQFDGVELDERTFVIALQACMMFTEKEDIDFVERDSRMALFEAFTEASHAIARKKEFISDTFVCNTLIRMYGRCSRKLENAESIFLSSCKTDVKVWNAMLVICVEHGEDQKALHLYRLMQEEGVSPDQETFLTVFQSCGTFAEKEEAIVLKGQSTKVVALEIVKALQVDANNKGLASDAFVKNTIVSVYGKCGAILEAETVFKEAHHCSIVSWNAMLSAYVDVGKGWKALQLFRQMYEEGVYPNSITFMVVLQACGLLVKHEDTLVEDKLSCLEIGHGLHADALRKGCFSRICVGNTLVSLYGKCGRINDAQNLFIGLSGRDSVSWSVMLSAYVEQGDGDIALQLYTCMQKEGISPDDWVFVIVLLACGSFEEDGGLMMKKGLARSSYLEIVRALHTDALKLGYTSNAYVCKTLVRMYGKCGSMLEAENVFGGLSKGDVVSWSAMLSALVEQSQDERALLLFKEMQELRLNPDKWTVVIVLQACSSLADKEQGGFVDNQTSKVAALSLCQELHDVALKEGFADDSLVGSTFVSTYGKCGCIREAENVFDRLRQCKILSWNAMLLAYVERGLFEKALQLHRSRLDEHVGFDDTTFFYSLQVGSDLGSLEACRQLHFMIVSSGYDHMPSIITSLTNAYGSCASMADAQKIFNGLVQPDVVIWTACISGHVQGGDCISSLQMLEAMQLQGVSPNRVTFLSLLSACNHAGLVDTGMLYYEAMNKDYGISPDLKHYAAMVELLGRAGYFEGVNKLIQSMSMQADLAIWLCLLGACLTHGNVDMGELAFGHAVHSHPVQAAAYVLMSNIYAGAELGLQDLAVDVR